jgi:hypothetical protein
MRIRKFELAARQAILHFRLRVRGSSMHLKSHSAGFRLLKIAERLSFEPHRIRLDPTGHYENFDRVPLVIRLFHFRHKISLRTDLALNG